MVRQGTDEELARADAMGRRLGVGCFTLVVGFFSGAMIATLIGKFLAFLTREPQCSGVPMCDWYVWFYTGGVNEYLLSELGQGEWLPPDMYTGRINPEK